MSSNTQSAVISVNGGTPVVVNLSASSPNCTTANGARVCTVTISAPVGSDTFAEALYANTTGTGTPLSLNTTTATIASGQANSVTMTLDGVLASMTLAVNPSTEPTGSASQPQLVVTFLDPSGAQIIGGSPLVTSSNVANPVTLTDSDKSGATQLATTTLKTPNDASNLTISYNGSASLTSATFTASASGITSASATLTTTSVSPTTFVDWPTYGYDAQRDSFNPYSTGITTQSLAHFHLAWSSQIAGNDFETQPIVVTNVIPNHPVALIIGNYVNAQAVDALSGAVIWTSQALPKQSVQACGTSGIGGTVQYVASQGALFMAAGNGGGNPNHVVLFKLDVKTGNVLSSLDVTPNLLNGEANDTHAAISYANGTIYVGTGSDCEGPSSYPSWRGRLVAVDPAGMTIKNTFFTTWQTGAQPGNYGGGGIWAWGGVSSDASGNIYLATGNAETNDALDGTTPPAPFVATDNEQAGYAEHLVKLSGDLNTVQGSDYPGFNFTIGQQDLDYTGVPVVMQPGPGSSCPLMTATQGKGGTLVVNNANNVSKATEVNQYNLSVPSANAYYMGNPAYSPTTGLLYAAISSAGPGSSLTPPGLAAIGDCGSSIIWHAQFGPDSAQFTSNGDNPRSAPTVTAGGVVFIGTPCQLNGNTCGVGSNPGGALWAVDASAGTVYGGKQLFATNGNIRMPPTVDGLWVWVYDTSGTLYAFTVDPTVPAASFKRSTRPAATPHFHYIHSGSN